MVEMFLLNATPFILNKYFNLCDLVMYLIILYIQVLLLTSLPSTCVRIKRLMLVNVSFYTNPTAIATHTIDVSFAPSFFPHQLNPKRATLVLDVMLLVDADM